MNPFFSIIIPVFNQEGKLEQGIRSVQNQTFGDFEAIVVDDGSTDHSVEAIQRVVNGDQRFRFEPHKVNRSVLEARRTGMKASRGEYIMFFDIDDFLEPDSLEYLHTSLVNEPADVLSYALVAEPSGFLVPPKTAPDMLKALLEGDVYPGLPLHTFSRRLITEALPHIKGAYCNLAEDFYIATVFYFYAKTYSVLEKPVYHYNMGEGMSTSKSTFDLQKFRKQVSFLRFALSSMREFLAENKPEYVVLTNRSKLDSFARLLGQYTGTDITWSQVLTYLNELSADEDADVIEWACTKMIPKRAAELEAAKQ